MGFLTAPSTVLSVVLATILAALFHLWQGVKARELLLYWPVALLGFLLGQAVANLMGNTFAMIGEVHLMEGAGLALVALFIAKWLKL